MVLNDIYFDDTMGTFLIVIFNESNFCRVNITAYNLGFSEAASLFSDHLILVNSSLGITLGLKHF